MSIAKNYEKSGVNIDAGESLVKKIQKINPNIGGFSGLFPISEDKFLVACTDGVGTKLELSIEMEKFNEIGQDLVAMSVNDLIVCGAKPLFFLDYYATGKLDIDVAESVIQGISNACKLTDCQLLGGETAEMPDFYKKGQFDLAGFAVGEVLKKDIINGNDIVEGDIICGLPSNGFHANGYSLIRKIISDNKIKLTDKFEEVSYGEYLTTPTKLYVQDILKIKSEIPIKGMAHITGGGLTNISRVIPKHLTYDIPYNNIPTPLFMKHIQNIGGINDEEAFTVWNMGMGFVIIINEEFLGAAKKILPDLFVVGSVITP